MYNKNEHYIKFTNIVSLDSYKVAMASLFQYV